MSATPQEIEKAEMMLSLSMNEKGEPLGDSDRAMLEQFLAENKPAEAGPAQADTDQGAPADVQEMVRREILKQMGQAPGAPTNQPVSLEQVLKSIDPRDSDAALALFGWLSDNGRFQVIGNLNGGGYLLHYAEPKGTTKAGYVPGGTKGGRMVDQAVQQAKDAGARPRKTGMCDKCWSAVECLDDNTIVTDDDAHNAVCSAGGAHTFNA